MTDTDRRTAGGAELRRAVLERFARKLDKYLPESGQLAPWKLGEIEIETPTRSRMERIPVFPSRKQSAVEPAA